MADPTIQTFCCHHSNSTDINFKIMQVFNTNTYNTVCIFSSVIGMLGAIYQILPREQFCNSHRWLSLSAARGRKIIVYLALADLMAAFGVFLRSVLWINYKNIMPALEDDSSVLFCAISSACTQYFYTSTWIWTLCYAIDMRFMLNQRPSPMKFYHVAAWILPILTTVTGLLILYFPNANCHSSAEGTVDKILPNYIITYVPIATVMIVNPCLYHYSAKNMKEIITSTAGQCTARERDMVDAIKRKFGMITFVFYLCWTPNFVNGFLLWILWMDLPVTSVISVWYVMAFLNPLQALFNCLVYRRWSRGSERVILPWRLIGKTELNKTTPHASSFSDREETVRSEIYPLLQNSPGKSINLYSSVS